MNFRIVNSRDLCTYTARAKRHVRIAQWAVRCCPAIIYAIFPASYRRIDTMMSHVIYLTLPRGDTCQTGSER